MILLHLGPGCLSAAILVMRRLWTTKLLGKNPQHETGCSLMTPPQCTKLQSGLKGMIIRTFQRVVLLHLHQLSLGRQVHLADASSHGTAALPVRSLTCSNHRDTASSNHHASISSRCRAIHRARISHRTTEDFLASAMSVDELATRYWSVV